MDRARNTTQPRPFFFFLAVAVLKIDHTENCMYAYQLGGSSTRALLVLPPFPFPSSFLECSPFPCFFLISNAMRSGRRGSYLFTLIFYSNKYGEFLLSFTFLFWTPFIHGFSHNFAPTPPRESQCQSFS